MSNGSHAQGASRLTAICQRLWELDANRLQPGQYILNPQRGKKSYMEQDVAPGPLFGQVDTSIFQQNSTYGLFFALLDNYTMQAGTAEQQSAQITREVQRFLDAVMQTQCMQYAHQCLTEQQLADANVNAFKEQLQQMWFRNYSREVRDDSSGFEHVFVGEARDGKVIGLHNWIQFSNEERKGNLDYKGYIFPRVHSRGGQQEEVDGNERMLSVQFTWQGFQKEISSMFIGTSPEFELALYTVCFLAGQEDNLIQVGDYQVRVKAYRIKSKYGDKVGSCYPELIQKVAGRSGAPTFAPAALHQQAPWHNDQAQAPIHTAHAQQQQQNGYQAQQNDFPALPGQQQQGYPQQQQGGYPQPGQYAGNQQQAWGQQQQQQQQGQEPAKQGCGGFLSSLFRALFGGK